MAGEKRGLNTFQKDISPKVNETARLEFEITYFEAAYQHFSQLATGASRFKRVYAQIGWEIPI